VTTKASTSRRRGRPRAVNRKSDLEPREEILRHAARLFSTAGVSATRVAGIASLVGVSSPAIYNYFENLDAIVEALLEYVVGESAAFATAVARRPGRCAERLRALIARHVERLTSGPYDLWFVAGLSETEVRRFPAVGRRAQQWRRAVARLVREGVDAGEFQPIDTRFAVAAISGLVYGALQLRHTHGAVDAMAVAEMAVRSLGAPRTERRGRMVSR
jgi:AcrR family transcriptional regulator